MKPEHRKWIDVNVTGDGYGQCRKITLVMQSAFPGLRRVAGFYYCPIWGQRCHWWLMDEETVIDPTAAQFPSKGQGEYRELNESEIENEVPIGVCANCGCDLFLSHKNSTVCSDECGNAYAAYCCNPF